MPEKLLMRSDLNDPYDSRGAEIRTRLVPNSNNVPLKSRLKTKISSGQVSLQIQKKQSQLNLLRKSMNQN